MKTIIKNLLLFTAISCSVCALAQNGSELAMNTQSSAPSPAKNISAMSAQQEELASKKQKSINNNLCALAIARAEIRASQARAIANHKDSASPVMKSEPEKKPATKPIAASHKTVNKTKTAPEKSKKPEAKKKEVKKSKPASKPKLKRPYSKKTGHKNTKAKVKQKSKKKN